MPWLFTDDPDRYADIVGELLARRPAANTVALTVLDTLRAGQRWSEEPIVLGWYVEDGSVTGAVSMTPPYGLLLSELPERSENELVLELRARAISVPDVNGTLAQANRFVAAWTPGTTLGTEVIMRQRLYVLDELVPPDPPPAGRARAAAGADIDLVMEWLTEFQREAEPSAPDLPPRGMYERRIELGLLWFWLDGNDEPVAIAGRNATVAGMTRVGPVYTPPRFRRAGYGAAVTAACTRKGLDEGADLAVLFTDLTNPTSNAIYQRLGYRAVEDRMIVRFLPEHSSLGG